MIEIKSYWIKLVANEVHLIRAKEVIKNKGANVIGRPKMKKRVYIYLGRKEYFIVQFFFPYFDILIRLRNSCQINTITTPRDDKAK